MNPDAEEIADDSVDQDCSGTDAITCAVDGDLDGHGNQLGDTTVAYDGSCDASDGETILSLADDCDDSSAQTYPGAEDLLGDGVDQDCDGVDGTLCAVDADQDGFGTTQTTAASDGSCDLLDGEAELDNTTDCDDGDPEVFPGADEIEDDGIDQDCDGVDATSPSDDSPAGSGCSAGSQGNTGGFVFALLLLVGLGLPRRRRYQARRGT